MQYVQIIFSPTGGTAKAAQAITGQWSPAVQTIDLCNAAEDFSAYAFGPEDMALIAVPSYGGRVPGLAAERLSKIRGNGARCVLVCVYGNRAYEDTLVEMEDLAVGCGFTVVAGVSAIAEHSIAHQYAAGRPDAQNVQTLKGYGDQILAKLGSSDSARAPELPGNRPYKKSGGGSMVPKAGKECVRCGLCAKQCPAQAIRADQLETADPEKCISCMRCVVKCPRSARKLDSVMAAGIGMALKKVCSVPKSCELFL